MKNSRYGAEAASLISYIIIIKKQLIHISAQPLFSFLQYRILPMECYHPTVGIFLINEIEIISIHMTNGFSQVIVDPGKFIINSNPHKAHSWLAGFFLLAVYLYGRLRAERPCEVPDIRPLMPTWGLYSYF